LFGPCHHLSSDTCNLSRLEEYETPLGNIKIDRETTDALSATNEFEILDIHDEEQEHSLELHLPYIYKVMEGHEFSLVPVMVGQLNVKALEKFGKIFSKYLDQPENLFIISTDFCHWGARFSYTYYDSSCGEIWQSIENLDRKAMDAIQTQSSSNFLSYLKEYKNTICGRHCISLLLETISSCTTEFEIQFVEYDQSSRCQKKSDSSVSYVSGIVVSKESTQI